MEPDRRSWLCQSALKSTLAGKAISVGADIAHFDLEDSVPQNHKDKARDQLIDSLCDPMPIRLIELPEVETALVVASELFRLGFYTSAVFFPIVPQGLAGLRVMCRVDLEQEQIDEFSSALADSLSSVEHELD